MQVIWSPTALRHILHAYEYLEDFNPAAAKALVEALMTAGDSLQHFPHRGRIVAGTDLRELVVVHPYVIRYRIVRETVRILRVRHSARRPTKP